MTSDDLQTAAETIAAEDLYAEPKEQARLVVYYGQGERTRIIELPDGARVGIGRSRDELICVDSAAVSRHHARIERNGRAITVVDLGSRNGTRINGQRIDKETALRSGDEVTVGPVTAVLSVTSAVGRRADVMPMSYFDRRLAEEADRGHRYRRSFGVVMIRIEGDDAVVDAAVERVTAQLRPMDVVADCGPDELAVLLPEVSADGLVEAARRLAASARDPGPDGVAAAVRVGAAAYPDHGANADALVSRALSALRRARRGGDDVVATPPPEAAPTEADVVADDPQMRRVFALVHKVAETPITVLLTGETGAGKEVVAEELHRTSARRRGKFLRLNCASIPETLLESELFGHERGAFTGAERQKKGYFEAADGGTLFLDEIGEISPGLQAKLLRVLEERTFTRVGGTQEISVDVRVVCATNRDLEAEVARGAFREDLYFRISAFTIVIPPLRDRRADLKPLAELFARAAARELKVAVPTLSPAAMQAIERHAWPGNVRELRNAIERAVVLQSSGVIDVVHLPDRVREAEAGAPVAEGAPGDVRDRLADVERAAIVAALREHEGNQTRAARALGLSRRALIYKLEKYGLKKPPRAQ